MRALKVATVVMGILILAGTAVLIAVIFKRATAPAPPAEQAAFVPSAAPFATRIAIPAGAHVVGIAGAGNTVAVAVSGGGADQVVMLDPRTGQPLGAVTLQP